MRPTHVLLALLVSVIWGFTFLAAKVGVQAMPPFWFSGLRFVLVAVLLFGTLRRPRGRWRAILMVCLSAGVLHYSCLYLGIHHAGQVSTVAIAVQLVGPFSVLLAALVLREHVGSRRLIGMLVAFLGVMLLGFDPSVFRYLEGLSLVVLGALFMSVALILMRRLRDVGVLELQGWIALVSAPPLLLLSLTLESGQLAATAQMSWMAAGALVFTALGASIVGQGGWYYLLQRYPVSQVAPYGLLAPLFGVAFAVVLQGDELSWRFLLGGAVTMAGVAVVTLPTRKLPPAPEVAPDA